MCDDCLVYFDKVFLQYRLSSLVILSLLAWWQRSENSLRETLEVRKYSKEETKNQTLTDHFYYSGDVSRNNGGNKGT